MELKRITLLSRPELLDDVLKLIESSLNYSSDNQYKIDFLPLVAKNNFEHIHLLLNGQKLIGVIGCYPGKLEYRDKKANTISIGAICISEEYRGKGLFKRFFQEIIDFYTETTALFFLWSDLFDLYHKFNFFPALAQFESQGKWELSKNIILKSGFIEFSKEEQKKTENWEQIRNIWENTTKRWWRFSRDNLKWQQIDKMESCHKYIRKNDKGEIIDYFFINKGEDLNNVIHEFGSRDNFAETLNQLSIARIWTPQDPKNPKIFLEGNSTLVRAGSLKLFSQFISDYTRGEIVIIGLTGTEVCFKFQEKSHTIPQEEFVPGVLGPFPFEELKEMQTPIFIGGVDSV